MESAGFQLGIPVKKIPPTLVEVVRREGATVLLELEGTRLERTSLGMHMRLMRQAVAFAQVAGLAGGDDVLPIGAPAARARHHMVEGQVRRRRALAAILAAEAIAQEHVEPGEGRPALLWDEFLERDDRRQLHREAGAVH